MSDNWSAFTTLTAKGDYIEWSVTLDGTAAAYLNSGVFTDESIAARVARQFASDQAQAILVVNDFLTRVKVNLSGGTWNDPARFTNAYDADGGYRAFAESFTNFPSDEFSFNSPITAGPWVDGSNTVRLLSLGPDPLDVDHVMLSTVSAFTGSAGETVVNGKPAYYDAHVNGTAEGSSVLWFLKAPDGTTGSVSEATFEIVKLCPIDLATVTVRVYVHDGATPATGEVGAAGGSVENGGSQTIERATLDGTGHATFIAPIDLTNGPTPLFWYGGDDDFGPETANLTFDMPYHGCGGWHVGRIGVG